MGRIMGIDWGRRRIGIALSDESRAIASPHTVVQRTDSLDRDLGSLADLAREHEVSHVVFGLPVRLDGSSGPEADGVMEVVRKLGQKIDIPVSTWDERFSTSAAERALIGGDVSRKRRRDLVDQVAAALILQAFLNSGGGEGS
jgi:putative Holliday junction resolvase